jgi:hypothetical protein
MTLVDARVIPGPPGIVGSGCEAMSKRLGSQREDEGPQLSMVEFLSLSAQIAPSEKSRIMIRVSAILFLALVKKISNIDPLRNKKVRRRQKSHNRRAPPSEGDAPDA